MSLKPPIVTFIDFDPTNSDDWADMIDRQLIPEIEFKYITLAYFIQCHTYKQIDFEKIKLGQIRKALEISPGKYKDYTTHYVRLGDPNPADNRQIVLDVIDRNDPNPPVPTTSRTHYTVALFISILKFYQNIITDDTDFEFSWGKRLNKATGQLRPTIIFRFNTIEGPKFFDYSSEEPTYAVYNPGLFLF